MSSDAKAAEYMAQGQKALKKTSFFSFGGSQKFEDASDLFEKAGNQYKIAKKCTSVALHGSSCVPRSVCCYADALLWFLRYCTGQEAADAYVKCADCQVESHIAYLLSSFPPFVLTIP